MRLNKKKRLTKILMSGLLCLSLLSQPINVQADQEHGDVATSGEMAAMEEVEKYGMTPIAGSLLKPGQWEIDVETSSTFFKVEKCLLTIEDDGTMTAQMYMYSSSYSLLYMGSAEDAAAAPYEDYIEAEDIDDWPVFTIPVSGLNQKIACAAFSKKKEKWYDRNILFDAASLDEEALNGIVLPDYDLIDETMEEAGIETSDGDTDGKSVSDDNSNKSNSSKDNDASESTQANNTNDQNEATSNLNADISDQNSTSGTPQPVEVDLPDGSYSVELSMSGGSGRAYISSPTLMTVKDGKAYARILWSSTYYDWMQVGDQVYTNETTDGGNSTFTIPITCFDQIIPIVADTTAMGDPTAINYSLTFYRETIGDESLIPQNAAKRVVIIGLIVIVGGFFLNMFLKKRNASRGNGRKRRK